MSPERPEQDDFLEDEEQDEYEGQRSIFATGWFRAVLVLLVLAVIAIIAVPLIGGWFEPTPPPKLATPAPPPKPSEPAPAPPVATPAPPPAPAPSASAPPAAAPTPAAPPAAFPPAPSTPAPTPPPAAAVPAPTRPEIPAPSAPTKSAEKTKAPDRTAALAPSKGNSKSPAASGGSYWVQVGAFKESRNAEGLAKTLRDEGFTVQIMQVSRGAPLHVVRVGGYPDRSRAAAAREDLQGKGHTGFVTSGPPK
ncbi:MAG TPA: SPOR domain-containing protein [Methylomirabilota bacterium]